MAISGDERRRRTGLSARQRSRENKRRNEEAKKMDRILQNGCRFLLLGGGSSLKMAVCLRFALSPNRVLVLGFSWGGERRTKSPPEPPGVRGEGQIIRPDFRSRIKSTALSVVENDPVRPAVSISSLMCTLERTVLVPPPDIASSSKPLSPRKGLTWTRFPTAFSPRRSSQLPISIYWLCLHAPSSDDAFGLSSAKWLEN